MGGDIAAIGAVTRAPDTKPKSTHHTTNAGIAAMPIHPNKSVALASVQITKRQIGVNLEFST